MGLRERFAEEMKAAMRAKDSRRPVVLLRGLERWVTDEDGPGAAILRRAREQDLFR